MTERLIDPETCNACKKGQNLLQKIRQEGHENPSVFYKAMFGSKPGELLSDICPRPTEGLCKPVTQTR